MTSSMTDFFNNEFIEDYIYNVTKTFQNVRKCTFEEVELDTIKDFGKYIFDHFDPNGFQNLEPDDLVSKIVDLITFNMMFKMEEMRLLQELRKGNQT